MNWMKIISVLAVILVSSSSCTITKQRYSNGFHVEWKKRLGAIHSTESTEPVAEYKEDNLNESISAGITRETISDQPSTGPVWREETLTGCEDFADSFPVTNTKIVSSRTDEKKRSKSTTDCIAGTSECKVVAAGSDQRKNHSAVRGDFWEAVTDVLFWLLVILVLITVSPVFHTALISFLTGYNWKSTLFIVLEWLLWIGGIIGIILLISGGWSIVLACLVWNLFFTIFFTALAIFLEF